jgi:hypothetical protein
MQSIEDALEGLRGGGRGTEAGMEVAAAEHARQQAQRAKAGREAAENAAAAPHRPKLAGQKRNLSPPTVGAKAGVL